MSTFIPEQRPWFLTHKVAEDKTDEVRRAHSRAGAAVFALYSRHPLFVIGAEGGGQA